MDFSEKLFNTSVRNSLILAYEFDKMIMDLNKLHKKSFYEILDKLCDINDIKYFENKLEENDRFGKMKSYVAFIHYKNEEYKSIKSLKQTKAVSKWFGKELLYLLRTEFEKNNIKLEYI